MFLNQPQPETQAEIDAATLRAMIDFTRICQPESEHLVARRPFTIHTREGVWTGAFLPDLSGAVAVQSELNGDVISANTRVGRDLSWALRNVGNYAREAGSVSEFEMELRDEMESAQLVKCGAAKY